MKKRILSSLGILLAVVIGIFVFSSSSIAVEFSADMILKQRGETLTGKVYVKGDKIRQEFLQRGEKQVIILRMDKNVVWNLMPEEKIYMEMSSLGGAANDPKIEQKIKDMAEKRYLGKEKVSGYVCEKYQYIYHDKSTGTVTQWFSKKLNYPIKAEHKAPSHYMFTEYKNIKEKKVLDSLFEIPAGYRKLSM
ncbi:MAG: DUF4412 domain-containing protein [Deltaproteobacteria bacterium]|nr:DUF4412 domain-containing protein [Deltaproteobacteria bacterium]